jgi:hypothetical protein
MKTGFSRLPFIGASAHSCNVGYSAMLQRQGHWGSGRLGHPLVFSL